MSPRHEGSCPRLFGKGVVTVTDATDVTGGGRTLKLIDLRGVGDDVRGFLPAPASGSDDPTPAVRAILDQVRAGGDRAVAELTARFDGVTVDELRVSPRNLKEALDAIPADLRLALEVAHDNVTAYHQAQLTENVRHQHGGLTVSEIRVPVDRAGLYVPGGRAPLASTVLMTAIPARVAGVHELAVCSPPGRDGKLAPAVLAAAAIAGVDEVYAVGGAQAIAALAYGTETISPVDVIAGPGNRFVALAERLVAAEGAVRVPPAFTGPSEVAVVADDSAPVTSAAIDLIVQAEHGPDGLAYLVTWSEDAADAIQEEVARLVRIAPRGEEIKATLERGGYCVLVDGPEQAMEVANAVAPEHLELITEDPHALVPRVRSAGAVFLGPWAPAAVGDYVAGPNHVLPTARSARFAGALRVDDFCKFVHVVEVDRDALERLAPHVVALATSEGMAAHADAVRSRVPETFG